LHVAVGFLYAPGQSLPFLIARAHTGTLCADIIQDAWSPCHNICTLLTSVQSLLTDPNCASPANPEAAHLYNSDRTAYNKRVRRLAQKSIEC
jgi:ubiquitin-conjugating enzyme E2 A